MNGEQPSDSAADVARSGGSRSDGHAASVAPGYDTAAGSAGGDVGGDGVFGWSRALAGLVPAGDDAARIDQIRVLEDIKAGCAAAQARITAVFAASQRAANTPADAHGRDENGDVSAGGTGASPARRAAQRRVKAQRLAHRSAAAQIALARRESAHRGGRYVGLADALVHEMHHTLAALQTGLINEWRAMIIVRETAGLSAEQRADVDAEIADRLDGASDARVEGMVKAIAYRMDPEGTTRRAARAVGDRRVTLRPKPDVMGQLGSLMPLPWAVACYAALKAAADAHPGGDGRTHSQRMADEFFTRVTGLPVPTAADTTNTNSSDSDAETSSTRSDTENTGSAHSAHSAHSANSGSDGSGSSRDRTALADGSGAGESASDDGISTANRSSTENGDAAGSDTSGVTDVTDTSDVSNVFSGDDGGDSAAESSDDSVNGSVNRSTDGRVDHSVADSAGTERDRVAEPGGDDASASGEEAPPAADGAKPGADDTDDPVAAVRAAYQRAVNRAADPAGAYRHDTACRQTGAQPGRTDAPGPNTAPGRSQPPRDTSARRPEPTRLPPEAPDPTAWPAGVGMEICLVITDRTLFGGGDDPAVLPGNLPIPAPLARRLIGELPDTAKTWIRRLYTRPDTGELLTMDARHRTFSPLMRRLLFTRDQDTCRTPWCGAASRHADHLKPFADGGPTSIDNGQSLSENCNYAREAPGWKAGKDPDGTGAIIVTTPTGHTYRSPAPDLIPGHTRHGGASSQPSRAG